MRIGFIPLADSAPLIAAASLGLFQREGVTVELWKAPDWNQATTRLAAGEIQGSHLLATTPLLSALEAGVPRLATAWVLSQSGNAITLSNRLWRAGVHDAGTLADWLSRSDDPRPLRFGVVHPRSTHEIMLREWLAAGGLSVGERIELVVIPPQEMVLRLREDRIDGFCAGEPWNQRAATSKLGGMVALGEDVVAPGMEKVLAVRRDWHESHQEEHAAVMRALDAASRWLSDPANAEDAARMLADRHHVNTREPLLLSALRRDLEAGWGRRLRGRRFLRFSGPGVNRPDPAEFRWFLERLVLWGHARPEDLDLDPSEICLVDFHAAVFPGGDGLDRLFDFENEFATNLRCIPMAVRRKLDLAGIKVSLAQWSRLPTAVRSELLSVPSAIRDDLERWGRRFRAVVLQHAGEELRELPPAEHPPWMQLDTVPSALRDHAQAAGLKLGVADWRGLDELERFALIKLSRPGHENRNFLAACGEFGLQPADEPRTMAHEDGAGHR